ncbi:hypothetical protein B0H13DRAFT_2474008 [Mycena leptocephala]|nr:hypothetical protein B0H13DRAFT_2474008 [Mycena leptocephala]
MKEMKDRAGGMKRSERKCDMSEDEYTAMPENRDIDAGYEEHGRHPTAAHRRLVQKTADDREHPRTIRSIDAAGRMKASGLRGSSSRAYCHPSCALPPPLYTSGARLPVDGMDHINYLLCIYSKEHGAVKWSTDPSQTAGTYLRNLLPDQGRVFRQLQARSTETVRKHIGGSARNLLPEQGEVFRQLRPVLRQVRSTETVRKHIGGSARNVLLEQGGVRSTETIRKHIGGSARNVLPEQGKVFRQFGSWTRGLWYRDNIYLAQWVVREKHPQVLSGTGPNRPPRPPPKKQRRLVMKWWPEVAKVAEVAEATSVTSALCRGYLRQTSART